jgi:hypothetical protein
MGEGARKLPGVTNMVIIVMVVLVSWVFIHQLAT